MDDALRARVDRLDAQLAALAARVADIERRLLAVEQGQAQAWQSQ